jgi:hypothetical protein
MTTRNSQRHGDELLSQLRAASRGMSRQRAAVTAAGPGVDGEKPAHGYIWHLWPGKNRPATAHEEQKLVSGLRDAAGGGAESFAGIGDGDGQVQRGVLTALMNALRCCLTAPELFERAPGLNPAELVFAYDLVDSARRKSVDAFDSIVREPTLESLVEHSAAASLLMGVPVREMTPPGGVIENAAVERAVARVMQNVDAVSRRAFEFEESLRLCAPGEAAGVEIGRLLYDPYQAALWSSPYFLSRRVGDLVPLRVADLLGERRR